MRKNPPPGPPRTTRISVEGPDHPLACDTETPVERIGMIRRQASVVSCARLVEGQRFNLQFLSLVDHIAFGRRVAVADPADA